MSAADTPASGAGGGAGAGAGATEPGYTAAAAASSSGPTATYGPAVAAADASSIAAQVLGGGTYGSEEVSAINVASIEEILDLLRLTPKHFFTFQQGIAEQKNAYLEEEFHSYVKNLGSKLNEHDIRDEKMVHKVHL